MILVRPAAAGLTGSSRCSVRPTQSPPAPPAPAASGKTNYDPPSATDGRSPGSRRPSSSAISPGPASRSPRPGWPPSSGSSGPDDGRLRPDGLPPPIPAFVTVGVPAGHSGMDPGAPRIPGVPVLVVVFGDADPHLVPQQGYLAAAPDGDVRDRLEHPVAKMP